MTTRIWLRRAATQLLLLATALPSACAPARATHVKGPDGAPGWLEISCRQSQDECAKKARELCGGPYTVHESDGRFYDGPGGAFYSGSMRIRCADPDAAASPATAP